MKIPKVLKVLKVLKINKELSAHLQNSQDGNGVTNIEKYAKLGSVIVELAKELSEVKTEIKNIPKSFKTIIVIDGKMVYPISKKSAPRYYDFMEIFKEYGGKSDLGDNLILMSKEEINESLEIIDKIINIPEAGELRLKFVILLLMGRV